MRDLIFKLPDQVAHVAQVETVLDIATGRGAVLLPAAWQVGPVGHVIGIDIAQGMVDETPAAVRVVRSVTGGEYQRRAVADTKPAMLKGSRPLQRKFAHHNRNQKEEITMLLEENKELVRRFLDEVMNAGNVSAIPEFMVPGSMFAGAVEWFVSNFIKVGCPDFHLAVEGVFGEADKVLVHTTLSATQTGPAMGHPPTGQTFTTTVIYIFKIANGKIISGQWVIDRMEIGQQLGWIPTPHEA